MKVIIIRSDPINPDVRAEKEAKSLAEFGHDVTILGWNRSDDCQRVERKNGYTIYRFNLKAPYGTISLIPYLVIWNLYILYYLIKKNYDVIHSCNLDTLIPSLVIGKIKRKKIIYDIFDFYGQMLPSLTPKLVRNLISHIERCLLNASDAVILADESRIIQLGNTTHNKIEYILNTPEYVESKRQISKANEFIIFYGGVLLETRGLRKIIEVVEESNNLKLIVAGYGKDESTLIPFFHKCKNVRYLGKITYDEIIDNTYEADLLFALYDPMIPNNKFASPNKLFEAMMCGKPIVVSADTTMEKIVINEKCGIVVNYDDVRQLKKTILCMETNKELMTEFGLNGMSAYNKKYSWTIMANRLKKLYDNL